MSKLNKQAFQQKIDGKQTDLYVLNNKSMQVSITNFGARLVSIKVPDNNKQMVEVLAGFDNLQQYIDTRQSYYGPVVGRFANRIARGRFSLEGKDYALEINNGPNHLHGGSGGFQNRVWEAVQVSNSILELNYFSKDGEEGYPGNMPVKVTYTLSEDASLKITYEAETDKTTIINLTNHAYFNLNGQSSGSVLDHLMQIHADYYTPIDETSIPYEKIELVAGTPFDFREAHPIGARIANDDEQLKNGSGYDHNFVLNKEKEGQLAPAAKATGNISGIQLEVLTTEPGMQFYTGNFMTGKNKMSEGAPDEKRTAFCLETQHFPDSPNHPNFPSVVLKAGEQFRSETIFRFSVSE